MLVVNFKNYSKAFGRRGKEIARECSKISQEGNFRVVVCPPLPFTSSYSDTEVDVFSQHSDPDEAGSRTGSIVPEALVDAGASGTLLNHSERRLDPGKVEETVERCREEGLETIVCAQSPEECGELSRFEPDFVAFEPPELIGGETSVSEAKPEMIEEAVENSSVPVLTGAGIKDSEDVSKSLELGCEGVLVASGIVKSGNVREALEELRSGF